MEMFVNPKHSRNTDHQIEGINIYQQVPDDQRQYLQKVMIFIFILLKINCIDLLIGGW